MPKFSIDNAPSRRRVLTRWSTTALAALLLASPTLSFAAAEAPLPSPKPWLKNKVEEARKLSERKVEPGTPAHDALKKEFKALIDDMLDWDTMIRKSLGRSWKDLTPKQQGEFSALLRKLIESSYQSKMRMASKSKKAERPKKVSIKWGEPKMKRKRASIEAKVKADRNKTVLGFELVWNGKRWWVYDVAIDDASTVRTYRGQFRKVIREDGFDDLMRRMRAKLDDIEAGRADIDQP
ncbi:MAG: ABC transporter substrate-binding protein [Myxococcota bacterium]